LSYATGSMSEGLAIVLATHLMQCSQCQSTLAEFEAVGGALLDTLPPVPLESGALDQLFDRPEQPIAACPVLHARYLRHSTECR
jgi:putative transcriptional regulator